MILFLFLTHLGLGIVFTLAFVSRDAGVKFFRFNAGLAALLIAIGFVFRPQGDAVPAAARVAVVSLACAEVAVVVYWATIGRTLASIRPALAAIAVGGGLVAIVAQAIAASTDRAGAMQALTVASFVSSAALLGGACTAMVLGHWYLVIPSLQVSHLQSIVKLHMASMAVRVALVAATVWFAIGSAALILFVAAAIQASELQKGRMNDSQVSGNSGASTWEARMGRPPPASGSHSGMTP